MKNNIIVTVVSIILIIAFALMKSIWIGFVYFAFSFLILLSIYWIAIIAINYIEDYKTNLPEGFKVYKAQLINSTNLTSQDIEDNKKLYIKKYKKTLRKGKLIEWGKILFLLSLIIIVIVSICTNKF